MRKEPHKPADLTLGIYHATLIQLKPTNPIFSIARSARGAISKYLLPKARTMAFDISRPGLGGFADSVQIDPSGIIRILGWCKGEFHADTVPSVRLDGKTVPFLQHFRFKRPDVRPSSDLMPLQAGLAVEYLVPASMAGRAASLHIDLTANSHLHFEAEFNFINAHYSELLSTHEVFHREKVYGSGPPNTVVNPELLELAKRLDGPILDFGCGRGALVSELQRLGREAHGLELDSAIIRESTPPHMATSITLYDGSFPSPFGDGSFRSVICSEVLEHIPDFQAAIRDIARLATEQVIFTVPDASAIPAGFRHGVVPWHLLEGTHVNFFNQQSLQSALQACFKKIEFGRLGLSHLNDTEFYVSLTASCLKD